MWPMKNMIGTCERLLAVVSITYPELWCAKPTDWLAAWRSDRPDPNLRPLKQILGRDAASSPR